MRPNKKLKNSCSGSADDKKNLHPGDRKSIFFNQFSGDTLFCSLASFTFFVFLFVF